MVVEHLDELYREVILDHFKSPRSVGGLPHADIRAEGTNPLCGDEIAFSLALQDGRVDQIRFQGKGCAISQATGSMLTEQLHGKTLEQISALIAAMKQLMQGQEPDAAVDLGDLESLVGVRKFPVRIKCAALSWVALEQGIEEYRKPSPGSAGRRP
jgi:nitrogen fixation NifU-like protein